MKETEIFLVRHGETFAKTSDNELGETFVCGSGSEISRNTHLTPNGRKQMFSVGEKYRDVKFNMVVVSDLVRSVESAEEFLKGAGQFELFKNLIVEKKVSEINYGNHDGVSEEIVKKAKDIFYKNLHPELSGNFEYNFDFKFENGEYNFDTERKSESFTKAGERMREVLLEIAKENIGKKVLVVSHSGAMRALHLTGQILDQNTHVVVGQDLKFGEVMHLKSDGEKLEKVEEV